MENFETWLSNNDLCDSIIFGVKLARNLKDLEINIDYYFCTDKNNSELKLVCINCFSLAYKLKDREITSPCSQFNIESTEVKKYNEYIAIQFKQWNATLKKDVTFFEVKCKDAFIMTSTNRENL